MLKYTQQEIQIVPPDTVFSPLQWLPFQIYDMLPKYPRYAPNPFMFNHPSYYFYEVAWHSNYHIVFPHSLPYRMLRAITTNNIQQMLGILDKGFGINSIVQKKYGYNALQIAAMTNHYPLIELLLLRGADIHSRDRWGNTPLILAVTNNNHEAIHSLIKNGGNPTLKNNYGLNAFDKATNNPSIKQFLKKSDQSNRKFPRFLVRLQLQQLLKPVFWSQLRKMKVYSGKVSENYLSRWQFDFCDYRQVQQLLR